MLDFELARVTAVRYVRAHIVWLKFSDGLEGEVDLADGLNGEMLEPLRDPALFAQVRVDAETIVWPNGADWAPETLYERLCAVKGIDVRSDDDERERSRAYLSAMPEVSRFFGVVIRMLANEYAPPHFHAEYGDYAISVTIRDAMVKGHFPGRALRLVLEWRDLHEDELLANWDRKRAGHVPRPIPPLF
jgi:hypothetical protein